MRTIAPSALGLLLLFGGCSSNATFERAGIGDDWREVPKYPLGMKWRDLIEVKCSPFREHRRNELFIILVRKSGSRIVGKGAFRVRWDGKQRSIVVMGVDDLVGMARLWQERTPAHGEKMSWRDSDRLPSGVSARSAAQMLRLVDNYRYLFPPTSAKERAGRSQREVNVDGREIPWGQFLESVHDLSASGNVLEIRGPVITYLDPAD